MEHITAMQRVIDAIDERITEKMTVRKLAEASNFSVYHFCRLFQGITGMPVMLYVTRRKLQYALYDLYRGKKVIDVAMEYGYETHAGFTKAFKRCFGYPPSLYRIHAGINPPKRIELSALTNQLLGGIMLYPQILTKEPFVIVGFTSRYTMPDVKYTHDIPAYWDKINMEYSKPLSRLHHTFTKSQHCEYSVCFDTDLKTGEFTYLLGVGVDNHEDLSLIEKDMHQMDMAGGLYAVFTTPLVESSQYALSIRDTWNNILVDWLPDSGYEFDEERYDFEYYDERDHAWEHGNMVQMDIYIPIQKRKC